MDRSPGNGPTVTTGFYIAFLFYPILFLFENFIQKRIFDSSSEYPSFSSTEVHINFIDDVFLLKPGTTAAPC